MGWLWVVGGAACILWGIAGAIGELRAMYNEVLDDAMAERSVTEEDRAHNMLMHAVKGGIGLPVFIGGNVMLRIDKVRRRHRNERAGSGLHA